MNTKRFNSNLHIEPADGICYDYDYGGDGGRNVEGAKVFEFGKEVWEKGRIFIF